MRSPIKGRPCLRRWLVGEGHYYNIHDENTPKVHLEIHLGLELSYQYLLKLLTLFGVFVGYNRQFKYNSILLARTRNEFINISKLDLILNLEFIKTYVINIYSVLRAFNLKVTVIASFTKQWYS